METGFCAAIWVVSKSRMLLTGLSGVKCFHISVKFISVKSIDFTFLL